MNKYNTEYAKQYTTQFSHHSMTDSQPVPKQQSQKLEITDSVNFAELPPQKRPNSLKSLNSLNKRAFKFKKKKKTKMIPVPQPTSVYKLSMPFMVWNISIGQLGTAVWLCSLPLLHTCSLAEYGTRGHP